jgi:cytochrome b subunit of formate dehydrogenase/nitrate/TMAO reductase-like tetraheme cytochrome c subunit
MHYHQISGSSSSAQAVTVITSITRILSLLTFLAIIPFSQPTSIAQSRSDCLQCHSEKTLSTVKNGRTISLFVDSRSYGTSAHGELDCVLCHVGFVATDLPHARKIRPVNCASCHSDERFQNYRKSVHGKPKKDGRGTATCADCHTAHAIVKLSADSLSTRRQFALDVCTKCHGAVHDTYMKSDHGKAFAAGVKGAPSCIDCHGEHEVLSPDSALAQTSRLNRSKICLRCHADEAGVRARVGPSVGFISSYENSVHAHAVSGGNDAAATCTDCHGSHSMLKGSNPASTVSKNNIAATCGQCHSDIREQYEGSIHGKTLASGVQASATCTDCHGEHNILSPKDIHSPVAAKNVSAQVCSPCHASVKLTQKYGLAADRFQSFSDSYHGLAGKSGSIEVANCASCHGVHDIKPSSDPSSRINKANLVRTCGTCHPGANENFTKGAVHVIDTASGERVIYFVSSTYIVLIIVTIGGMALHNILDFVRKSKRKLMERRGLISHHNVVHRLYLRMSLGERIQHALLLVSFFTLVFTGFALKFPDAWWVVPLRDISPVMFELRGLLHRIAAVVMVAASLYHCYYVTVVPRGRQLFRDLRPTLQDVRDAIAVLKYNLGFSGTKPEFGRFSYIEKSEYWALVWGTVVMAITGTILWFDNTFLGLLTKLWWDVARTVHYYEAWLATLAIFVWHFYFVIFNPDTYPINLAFWKGTLTEQEMAEEHPLELERLKRIEKKQEAEDRKPIEQPGT